jgi:hypothetical protein
MSSYGDSKEVPGELLEYLEQGPQGDIMRLTKLAQSLNDGDLESGVKAFGILGTTVGKQSGQPHSTIPYSD